MDYKKDPCYENYLALAYTILNGNKNIPNFTVLQDKEEAKKRIKEIKEIRAKGGKTELEQLFPKCKYVGPTNNKKVYVLDVDLNKRYYFKSKREAIKKLKLGQKEVKDIICGEKIKIKQIRPGDFLNVIKTGYPNGFTAIDDEEIPF